MSKIPKNTRFEKQFCTQIKQILNDLITKKDNSDEKDLMPPIEEIKNVENVDKKDSLEGKKVPNEVET